MTEYIPAAIQEQRPADGHAHSIPGVQGSVPPISKSAGLKAQLAYAGRNIPTFPCEGKRPLTPRGFKDATTDPRRITAWRHRWPSANVGMPTGERSGVFVVDVDDLGALEELQKERGGLPATLSVGSPSGGLHLYFRHVEGITNSTGGLSEGIHVRGEGGYVMVPPSAGYGWEDRTEIAEAPGWLVELVRERRPETPSGGSSPHDAGGGTVREGRRNAAMVSILGRAHDGTRTEEELVAYGLAVRDARFENPATFTDAEVRAVAHWVHRKEPCRTGRPPEVEERVAELEAAFWGMWGEDFRGLGGQSDRDLLREILECAARWGRVNDAGEVEFDRSTQDMALGAGISRPTVHAAARRLGEKMGLRRDTGNRKASHAGTWVLPTTARVLSTRIKASLPPGEEPVDAVVKSCAPPVVGLSTPTFRHFGPVGKGRGGIMLALEAFGPASAEDLADRLGVARPRDLRRRYLDPLVEEGRVELRGGLYALPGDHAERCDEAKARPYSSRRRRRVRSWSQDEGRRVVRVVEVGSESSENERDGASRRAYADQRELFLSRLARSSPEADDGCRELLNEMDREREAAGEIPDISRWRDVTSDHPPGCQCPGCYYDELRAAAKPPGGTPEHERREVA